MKVDSNEFLSHAQGKELEFSGFVDVMIMELDENIPKLQGERKVKARNLRRVLGFYRHNYAEMFKVVNRLKQENAELRRLL